MRIPRRKPVIFCWNAPGPGTLVGDCTGHCIYVQLGAQVAQLDASHP